MTTTAPQRVLAQGWFEFTAILRNGEQVLLNIIMPLLALIIIAQTSVVAPDVVGADRISLALVAGLTIAIMSSSFTSIAIATGFDRRAGVLRYLGTTPLRRSGLLLGKGLAVVGLVGIQILMLTSIALAFGWRFDPIGLLLALIPTLIAAFAFASWALLLAGTLRAEAVLALANLIWVFLIATAGALLADTELPAVLGTFAGLLPSGALITSLSDALLGTALSSAPLAVLGIWLVGGAAATLRWFKWD